MVYAITMVKKLVLLPSPRAAKERKVESRLQAGRNSLATSKCKTCFPLRENDVVDLSGFQKVFWE